MRIKPLILPTILVVAFSCSIISSVAGAALFADLEDDAYYDYSNAKYYPWEPFLLVSGNQYHSFLKFNLSNIPKEAQNLTAILSLYSRDNKVATEHLVEVRQIFNETWDEGSIPHLSESGKLIEAQSVSWLEGWNYWNVTSAVHEALSKNSSTVTFLVCYPNGTDGPQLSFSSKEGSIKMLPSLEIQWISNATLTPTPTQIIANPQDLIYPIAIASIVLLALVLIVATLLLRRKH